MDRYDNNSADDSSTTTQVPAMPETHRILITDGSGGYEIQNIMQAPSKSLQSSISSNKANNNQIFQSNSSIITKQPTKISLEDTNAFQEIPLVESENNHGPGYDENKKKLICRLPFIIESTANVSRILIELLSRGILHWRERDNIMAHASDYDRIVEICKIVLHKGHDGHQHFIQALLLTGNKESAKALMEPLSDTEAHQSLEECLLELNMIQKTKLGAALLEVESFYNTIATTSEFYFLQNGKPGILGVSRTLTEYIVINKAKRTLFYLLWKPTHAGLQLAHMRPFNMCDTCCPPRRGVTRICQNLLGNTIMEMDTELSEEDIRIGGEYKGQINTIRYFSTFIAKYDILNAINQTVFCIKRKESFVQHFTCFDHVSWIVYDLAHPSRIVVATFGYTTTSDYSDDFMASSSSFSSLDSNKLPNLELKFINNQLDSDNKMLILGAAIMVLDHRTRVVAWSVRKLFIIILILLVMFLIILFTSLRSYAGSFMPEAPEYELPTTTTTMIPASTAPTPKL